MSGEWYEARILAIDPTSRGFGYVVFEGTMRLIDWAVVSLKTERDTRTLARIGGLLLRCHPDVVVLEKSNAKGSRRGKRVRRLLEEISELARSHHCGVRRYSRIQVRQVFDGRGARNKHDIAAFIAESYPELFPRLPRYRKPWMPEDERMAIFDAASFALAYFAEEQRQSDTDRK
jgi:Holliday junction resolvasome RuvABC endonuclease subunit